MTDFLAQQILTTKAQFQPDFTQSLGHLYLDIVDYPGEWLLDLPLLDLSYAQWSEQIREQLQSPQRRRLAEPWLKAGINWSAGQPFTLLVDEVAAVADLYTQ